MNIDQVHAAALNAGRAGDLRALLNLAGGAARLVLAGAPMPGEALWLWDPNPIVGEEEYPPIALTGPELLDLWNDPKRREDVCAWLGRAVGRAYAGDWGSIERDDRGVNEHALKTGARLLCVYPWYGKPDGNRDLWVWVEAAHGEDIRFRRVTIHHRADY